MHTNIYTQYNEINNNPFLTSLFERDIIPHNQTKPVYKYVPFETALIILSNCTMRFSSPVIFNDPFEMNLGFLDFDVKMSVLRNNLIAAYKEKYPTLNNNQIRKKLQHYIYKDLKEAYIATYESQRKQSLVLCTSRTNSNTLMWSHYADKHNGVCIGLIVPVFYEQFDMVTLNVSYESHIERLSTLSENKVERAIALYKWICTKSKVWEYEEEVRSFIPNTFNGIPSDKTYYFDFTLDPKQIVEIYYGVGVNDEQMATIQSIVNKKGYNIQKSGKMEINPGTFDLKLNLY